MTATWDPLGIDDIRRHLDPTGVDWWIAGGVAIDLFLGWSSRIHEDVDVELFRRDRDILHDAFAGWEIHAVSDSGRRRWDRGRDLPESVFIVNSDPQPTVVVRTEVMQQLVHA